MSFRFRRSIKIAPGLRVNFGKRGMSLSAGVRGASVTYGRNGLYGNVGLPGTGISFREKLGGGSLSSGGRSSNYQSPVSGNLGVQFNLKDDGTVEVLDAEGNPLPTKYVKMAREQKGEVIQKWLEAECDKWNKGIDVILGIHLETPPIDRVIVFEPEAFDEPLPLPPNLKTAGFLGKIFKSRQQKVEEENQAAEVKYQDRLQGWKQKKAEHDENERIRREFFEKKRFQAPEGMQDFLAEVIAGIEWPRETLVAFEVADSGKVAYLDVDFPEVEDMPTEQATVAARGLKVNVKKRSETQRRKEYMTHIHAILFRLTGETYVSLPSVETVVASGFSQRPNKQTGNVEDEYLLSVRVGREQWNKIAFGNLKALDLVECFTLFDLRRNMTATGVFQAIKPFDKEST